MSAKFVVREVKPDSIYIPGDVFGVFTVKNVREARAMKMNIEDCYSVKVDYYVY